MELIEDLFKMPSVNKFPPKLDLNDRYRISDNSAKSGACAAGTDVVVLHIMDRPGKGLPNLSPYVVKLETFLRLEKF